MNHTIYKNNDNCKTNNLNFLKNNASILIIGQTQTGKSILVQNILSKYEELCPVIISPAEKMCPFYKTFYHKKLIGYKCNEHIINKLFNITKIHQKNMYIILDDFKRYKYIMKICNENDKLNFIITTQWIQSVLHDFDYIFIAYNDITFSKKKLYKYCVDMFVTFENFEQFFNKITLYEFMVIDKIENKIYKFKADPNKKPNYDKKMLENFVEEINKDNTLFNY